ncbi:MAG: InlB B-repeat-containing protein, partial [Lachnospiraceae bacterium]|nr:InlB B-repeat-containing protein [Lachnospiraceae bacterium]
MEGKRTNSVNHPKHNLTKGRRHRKTLGRRLEQLIAIAMALLVFINVPLSALADEDLPVPAAAGGESAPAAAAPAAEPAPAAAEPAAAAPAAEPAPAAEAPAAPAETTPDTTVTDPAQAQTPAVPGDGTQAAQGNPTDAVNAQGGAATPSTSPTDPQQADDQQQTPTPATSDNGTANGTPGTAPATSDNGTANGTTAPATGATDDAATDDSATGASGDSGSSATEDAALSTSEGLTQVQTIRTYVFLVDGEEFASVAITNGDVLYDPGIPEATKDGEQFEGWFDGESRLSFGTVDDIPEGTEETREILARFTEKPYPAQSFSARAGFLRIEVTTDEGTFPENTTMKAVSVSKARAIEAAQEAIDADPSRDEEVVDALAVDITFYDEDGEEIQPVNPSGVHVTLTALREIKGESQDVAHIAEGGQSTIISSADVSGNTTEKADGSTAATDVTASFDAEHFSVYAIIGTEGYKTDDTIRRTYIFYSDHEEEGVFTEWSRQVVKNGDILLEPALPTKTNQYFIGWYLGKDHSLGSGDTEMHFGTVDDITGTTDSEGNLTDEVVELHAHFSAEYAVRLYEHFGGNYEIIEIKEAMPGTVVSLAGVYSRNLENNQQISSWALVDANFQPLGTTYSTTDSVTLGTEDIYLLANVESIYKLEFYVNHTEALKNDATRAHSVLPVYVPDGGSAAAYMPNNPTRTGYTFGGWYMEETCVNAFNKDALLTEAQDLADGTTVPDYVVKLYAKWVPDAVPYEVFVWHEVLNEDGTDPEKEGDGEKKYAVAFTYEATAPAATAIDAAAFRTKLNTECTKSANAALIKSDFYERNEEKLTQTLQSLVPAGDGSTIFHVYYDLKVIEWPFKTTSAQYKAGLRLHTQGGGAYDDAVETVGTGDNTYERYVLRAKMGEDVTKTWPEMSEMVWPGNPGSRFVGWRCGGSYVSTCPITLSNTTIGYGHWRTGSEATYSGANYFHRYFLYETLDGDRPDGYIDGSAVHSSLSGRVFMPSAYFTGPEYNLLRRDHDQYFVGSVSSFNGTVNVHGFGAHAYWRTNSSTNELWWYFIRNRHNLILHNHDKTTTVTGIQYAAPIESYIFTPDYKDTSLNDLGVVYEFKGWYTDRAYQNKFDATGKTMPDNNLELFAKWEPKTVTLTFDGNGAKFTDEDVAGYEDRTLSEDKTKITIQIPAGTKLGSVNVPDAPDLPRFHFRDWIVNGHSVNFDNRVFTDDTTITANWGAEHYVKVQYVSAE